MANAPPAAQPPSGEGLGLTYGRRGVHPGPQKGTWASDPVQRPLDPSKATNPKSPSVVELARRFENYGRVACASCGRPVGKTCIKPSGWRCPPHGPRLAETRKLLRLLVVA